MSAVVNDDDVAAASGVVGSLRARLRLNYLLFLPKIST